MICPGFETSQSSALIGWFQTGWLFVYRTSAAHPITNAMIWALPWTRLFAAFGGKIQATRLAGGR